MNLNSVIPDARVAARNKRSGIQLCSPITQFKAGFQLALALLRLTGMTGFKTKI